MNCDCIERIDKELAEKNVKLDCFVISFSDGLLIQLGTAWTDPSKAPRGRKKRPPIMVASHCPFCGAPWKRPIEEAKTTEGQER